MVDRAGADYIFVLVFGWGRHLLRKFPAICPGEPEFMQWLYFFRIHHDPIDKKLPDQHRGELDLVDRAGLPHFVRSSSSLDHIGK